MDKKELWHEMLTTYCSRMHYTGLTLPNMIGAYYYYCKFNYEDYDLSSSNCVFRVLDDISNSLKDMGVLIRYCGHIRKYVLSPLEDKNMQHWTAPKKLDTKLSVAYGAFVKRKIKSN